MVLAMMIISWVLTLIAISQLVLGALAWSGKLPGNGVIGLRIPEVRKSKEMWVLTHRIAGPLWTLSGVAIGFGAFISFGAQGWMWAVVALGVLLWLILLGMGSGIAANAAATIDAQQEAAAAADSGCCSAGGGEPAAASPAADSGECNDDPSADCGVTGGCGSCSLNGSCEGGGVNFDALRKAAEQSDAK